MAQPHFNLYFREIIYRHPSAKKNSVCGVFSYEALNVEEVKLGNLYLVGKISNIPSKKHKSFDFLLSLLASAIKRDFYVDPRKTTIEAIESALQGANIYLSDFTKRGHDEWVGNLDFTCMAFSQNNIHIGQTGNMLIYILRDGIMSNITRKFALQPQNNQPLKTFSNIASGTLAENDKLIIATSDILEIASIQKIKELLSSPSNEQFYDFVKDYLENQGKNKDMPVKHLSCLLLEAKSKMPEKEKKPIKEEVSPEISVIDLEDMASRHSLKFNEKIKNRISVSPNLSKTVNIILKSHVQNYLLFLFLSLAILLLPYLIGKIYYEFRINQVNNLIKRTNETMFKSQTALAYQEQTRAKSLLQQADVLMNSASSITNQLPEMVREKPFQAIETIRKSLGNQKNSINNIINIEEPEEISDISKNSFSFTPQGILKLDNTLYFYELNSGFLYKINMNEINNGVLVFLSSKDTFKLGAVRDGSLVLLSSPEKVYIYSKNDNYNTYLLKPGVENTLNIKDITSFENNLYFLDTEKLNILKYSAEETFYSGVEWIKNDFKQDLIDAQSLAVDGSIYVLKSNGVIFEYNQGKRIREIKLKISPSLDGGGQLFTNAEMKNLYILDPLNKRIIIQNKKDDFSIQYMSDKFDSLKDFWIDPGEKIIYILNDSKVYRIEV